MLPEEAALPSFFQTRLAGALLRVQRSLAGARGAFAALAAGAYFLVWHLVHRTNAGDGLGCLFTPDCHPGSVAMPIHDTGESFVCTGYLHFNGSLAVPVLAVALAVTALLGLLRPRLWVALLLEVVGLALCIGIGYALLDILSHMFDRVEKLWGERLFNACFLLLVLSYVIGPALQSILVARNQRGSVGSLLA